MSNKAIPVYAWFVPLAPLGLALVIYLGQFQTPTFLFINQLTQLLPATVWAWLTFIGNGWGVFAITFPLLLLAPRIMTAGIFAGAISAIVSAVLKNFFDLPRPAGVLVDGSFYRLGEPLLQKAFPSGHTLTAFAIATALYFACDKNKRGPVFVLFIVAALVGISRNAVGAHWLTDVLGGAGFGIWCGILGALFASRVPEKFLAPKSIWLRLIAFGGVAAIYAHFTQIMDHELNLPLQYVSIALISMTLIVFIKAQVNILPSKLG